MKEACVHGSALRLLQNNDIGGRFLDDTEALKFQLADYRCLSVFPEPGARVSMNLLMQRLSETSVVSAKFLRSSVRHCERSEAISSTTHRRGSDCRVALWAPNKKKEHNLATMRRGYPAFFVQGGSAAGRWETRNNGLSFRNQDTGSCC